jgi:hypothetical protein
MIFTDTPIKDGKVFVRFYYYADTERGYGDAGTAAYANVPVEYLKEERKERHESVWGEGGEHRYYYTYKLDYDWARDTVFGGKDWAYEIGYGMADTTDYANELAAAEETVNRLKAMRF